MPPVAHGFADSIRSHPRALGQPAGALRRAGRDPRARGARRPGAGRRTPAEAPVSTYLALGDSISFGYSEQVFDENFPNESPSFFEEGFTNDFAEDLARPWEAGRGVTLVNDACPGETSNGLIGENPALGGKASTEPAGPRPAGARRLPPVRVQQRRRAAAAQLAERRRAVDLAARRRAEHPQRRPSGAPGRCDHAEHRLKRRARGDQAVRESKSPKNSPTAGKSKYGAYARSGGGRAASR